MNWPGAGNGRARRRRPIVNLNHPFTREHGSTQEQLRLLRDAALVELLTDAFMADLGLPDEQIKEILDYKERAYRLVAQVRRHSAAQIASMLVEATDHVKGFERIVGDALESMGFEVDRLGQTGEPEGVATALITASPGDQKVLYRFTYDAKSSVSGKASTHNVGISGLARHKKEHNAEHALVVAPDFAEGALEAEASEAGITPIRAKDLASLVMLTAGYGALNLAKCREMFDLHHPQKVREWIDRYAADMKSVVHIPLDTLIQSLIEITKANPERPDMLDCSLIAEQCRKILKSATFPTRQDVLQVIRGLSYRSGEGRLARCDGR